MTAEASNMSLQAQLGQAGQLSARNACEYVLTLPEEEPPGHVLDALRTVRDWVRSAEARQKADAEARLKAFREAMRQAEARRASDWRETLFGDRR